MNEPLVRHELDDHGVAYLTLDSPATRNALSDAMLDELLAALESARQDERVRVVVLGSSHDKVFSAGGDLKSFAGNTSTVVKYQGLDRFPVSTRPSAAWGSRSSAPPAATCSPGRSGWPSPATW